MKRVLIPFTQGVEEIECVAVVDILRRAGVEVIMASLDGNAVTGRSNITIMPDAKFAHVSHEEWDMIVLPGGLPNAYLLRDSSDVKATVLRLKKQGKIIAGICAASTALAAFGVADNKHITSYPAMKEEVQKLAPTAIYLDDAVVEDDSLITSRGAGTAIEFALRLIEKLYNKEKSAEIRTSIIA